MIETITESRETDELEGVVVDVEKEVIYVEEEEEIIEDVPFIEIENAPVFPGVRGVKKN